MKKYRLVVRPKKQRRFVFNSPKKYTTTELIDLLKNEFIEFDGAIVKTSQIISFAIREYAE